MAIGTGIRMDVAIPETPQDMANTASHAEPVCTQRQLKIRLTAVNPMVISTNSLMVCTF